MEASGQVEASEEVQPELTSADVATGVLEHDLARHEVEPVAGDGNAEVLDLGRVEGLSAAPSSLTFQPDPEQIAEKRESATIESTE